MILVQPTEAHSLKMASFWVVTSLLFRIALGDHVSLTNSPTTHESFWLYLPPQISHTILRALSVSLIFPRRIASII